MQEFVLPCCNFIVLEHARQGQIGVCSACGAVLYFVSDHEPVIATANRFATFGELGPIVHLFRDLIRWRNEHWPKDYFSSSSSSS